MRRTPTPQRELLSPPWRSTLSSGTLLSWSSDVLVLSKESAAGPNDRDYHWHAEEKWHDQSPPPVSPKLPTLDTMRGRGMQVKLHHYLPVRVVIDGDRNEAKRYFRTASDGQHSELTSPSSSDRHFTTRSPTTVVPEMEPSAPSPCARPLKTKRQRYLRDVDRRCIIRRIDNGEKQAALAREFGVTRAAICHIKKNRDEIVSRYDSLVQSAIEMEHSKPAASLMVRQLTRSSVLLLLTTLRDTSTPLPAFRVAADRLMMVLLEEAIAGEELVPCQVRTTSGAIVNGVKSDPTLCCVAVGEQGLPLLRLYHRIEARGDIGCAHVDGQHHEGRVHQLELPREMSADSPVLLLACTSTTGRAVVGAIRALIDVGIGEEKIRVVTIACTAESIGRICGQFPGVRILTCVVEKTSDNTPRSTSIGDFHARYVGVKVERAEPGRSPYRSETGQSNLFPH